MNTKETRCTAAIQYRKNGANCAQSLLAAFSDILNITEVQALAMGAGLGGGVRSGNICGAVNAPVMTLAATSAGAYTRMDGVPVTQTATSSCPALCPKAASTLTTQSSRSGKRRMVRHMIR